MNTVKNFVRSQTLHVKFTFTNGTSDVCLCSVLVAIATYLKAFEEDGGGIVALGNPSKAR